MSANIKNEFKELTSYLDEYSLHKIVDEKTFRATLKSIYQRYHALLVWNANIEGAAVWKDNAKKDEQFRAYAKECTSDACQSVLLFVQGFYKPAYLILRSSIENIIKAIGIAEDQNVLSLTSVFEIIEVVKYTNIIQSSKSAKKQFSRLKADYTTLCKYVHTADSAHMSHTSVAGVFPFLDKIQAASFDSIFRSVMVGECSLLCILLRKRLKRMHHKHLDMIMDIVPRDTKLEIMS
jgi:hypothetical protein